jgi:hypothetical protein
MSLESLSDSWLGCGLGVCLSDFFLGPLMLTLVPVHPAEMEATWFTLLQNILPHSWIDEWAISSKGMKHDDVALHTPMWGMKVTLLYPWCQEQGLWILSFFRLNLMHSYHRRFLHNFQYFMSATHGALWPYQLDHLVHCWAHQALPECPVGYTLDRWGHKWQQGG